MDKKQISLEVVNPNAAGIDIGSRSHWMAVGQNAEDVKEFGVYSEDQMQMCDWLREKSVTSIAMESTGTYWQNLFSTLVGQGFDVIFVNGRQTKNIKGKKTDIKDCQMPACRRQGYKNCTHSVYFLRVFFPIAIRILSAPIQDTD